MSIIYSKRVELYHLLNRGVEKREVVLDDADRRRFLHDLFVFNDENYVDPNHGRRGFHMEPSERVPLIDIHAFCLMGNHYHLLVSELRDEGIPNFMRKLNMGYAKYFNEKYDRSGVLWQGPYKKILIQRNAHFLYIPLYIHLNPLDFLSKEWRRGNIKNFDRAIEYLREYRWSSFRDYINIRNYPSILSMRLLKDSLGSSERQIKILREIVSSPEIAAGSNELE